MTYQQSEMRVGGAVVFRCGFALVIALTAAWAMAGQNDVVPLENAHAHNDYEHDRPLFDALDQGFTSVEADVFPAADDLLVGHDPKVLRPARRLEILYLKPLAERVRRNNGHVYSQASRFLLLIDIKDKPQETYRILQQVLPKYSEMLTAAANGKLREGAVTIVLTGARPEIDGDSAQARYAALDGRLSDLNSRVPAHLMPMISEDWTKHFQWDGHGEFPLEERTELQRVVKKAHAASRVVRFWKTPEKENVWKELRSDGVDLINTDQLARLAAFLRMQPESGKR